MLKWRSKTKNYFLLSKNIIGKSRTCTLGSEKTKSECKLFRASLLARAVLPPCGPHGKANCLSWIFFFHHLFLSIPPSLLITSADPFQKNTKKEGEFTSHIEVKQSFSRVNAAHIVPGDCFWRSIRFSCSLNSTYVSIFWDGNEGASVLIWFIKAWQKQTGKKCFCGRPQQSFNFIPRATLLLRSKT